MNAAPIATSLAARCRLWALDGALLGCFMVSACGFATLLEYPDSPVRRAIENADLRRLLMGLAMGLTALTIIYSPLGKRTGPLMNPAMVLTVLRLGRLTRLDAAGFIAAQFLIAPLGVGLIWLVLRASLSEPPVRFASTLPGSDVWVIFAWLSEFLIAMTLVVVVLTINKRPKLTRFSGAAVACLVVLFITFEAPISGMSLNPARSFASAFFSQVWTHFWIYMTAPVLGMLAGAELIGLLRGEKKSICGKLAHGEHCVLKCNCLEHHSPEKSQTKEMVAT